jgi:hypothetical protein
LVRVGCRWNKPRALRTTTSSRRRCSVCVATPLQRTLNLLLRRIAFIDVHAYIANAEKTHQSGKGKEQRTHYFHCRVYIPQSAHEDDEGDSERDERGDVYPRSASASHETCCVRSYKAHVSPRKSSAACGRLLAVCRGTAPSRHLVRRFLGRSEQCNFEIRGRGLLSSDWRSVVLRLQVNRAWPRGSKSGTREPEQMLPLGVV